MSVLDGVLVFILYVVGALFVAHWINRVDNQPDNPVPVILWVLIVAIWPLYAPVALITLGVISVQDMANGRA